MAENTLNKTDILYTQLRQEIGKHAHGERFFSVRGIMRRYAVSQSVVDRTLLLLRTEGLLTATPGSGLFVCAAGMPAETPKEEKHKEALLLVPRWPSCDIDELNEQTQTINQSASEWRIKVDCFDYTAPIPRNFDATLRRSDGMVILPAGGDFSQADLNALSHYCSIKPTIVLGHPLEGLKTGCVGLDNYYAGNLAMHHLAKHGHRRIGLLLSEPHNKSIMERVRGACGYAKLHGLEITVIDCKVVSGQVATTRTYDKFTQVIQGGFTFTALLGVSGESIQGAVNACHNSKVSIPNDLSVAAIGGERLARISSPPLDIVAANVSAQFQAALDMIDLIAAAKNHLPPEEFYLQTELMEYGSVLDRKE